MTIHIVFISLSLVFLFLGAEAFVRGSAALALRTGMSPLVVGLTVVAFGTSAPELMVSMKAALSGQGAISVSNAIGSNTFNIGIILGLTALVCPIPVHFQMIRRDAPIALAAAVLVFVLMRDFHLGRFEALLLLFGLVGYVLFTVMASRRTQEPADGQVELPRKSRSLLLDVVYTVIGLAVMIVGSQWLVEHAVELARGLGVSETVIGLTIISAGTSMPELATSLVAAIRKQPDIAIGNVVGSNIFNMLGILGTVALVSPLDAGGLSVFDFSVMVFFSALLIPLLYTGRLLHRVEGILLLAGYLYYVSVVWP